jgi:putative transcriptional regulator
MLKLPGSKFYDGQFLIAMPAMTDKRFARSVVYMCAHSEDGAMGLIVNQPARNISAPDLLEKLGVTTSDGADGNIARLAIQIGGPVEAGRGFVLHSADFNIEDSTMTIDGRIALTATIDILRAIVEGRGPERAILALGYAGWSPGQLEDEIQANGWLTCPADPEIIFDPDTDQKYHRALGKLGVDLSHLVSEAGHC